MWRRLFPKRTLEADLEDELQAHLAIEVKQLVEEGMPPEDAAAEARRRFGSGALVREAVREADGWAWLGRFWQDFRYGARVLRKAPGFTTAAVLSLALGIGATTAVFSIADTVFLRPLPYAGADRLVWVAITFDRMGGEFVPSPDYVAWRRDNRTFEALAATQASLSGTMLLGGDDPAEVKVAKVSANYLDAFAVRPAMGRSFRTEEELPNGPRAVLLTDGFWREHFAGRRDVVGSAIPLDGQPYTVAGVLPGWFVFPVDEKIDMLTTLPVSPGASHRDRGMATWAVFGRMKQGVRMAQARADLERLLAASKADAPQFLREDNKLVLQTLQEHRAGDARKLLLILLGASVCLLAIACANVANLLLSRWSARARELAVRAAVGAGRGRLARQLFAEILLLVAAGTAVALGIAAGAIRGFVHFAAGAVPRLSEAALDFRVFGIALLVSMATALVFGGLPALRTGRLDLQPVLQQAGRGGSAGGHRMARRTLVVTEMALSVVLLSGATLLFQTLWHMRNDHLGFQPERVMTVTAPLAGMQLDGPLYNDLADEILTALRRLPGTQAASQTQCSPLSTGSAWIAFSRVDRPLPEAFHRGDGIGACGTDEEYLKAAGGSLRRGRFFTAEDRSHPEAYAVINETAARTYLPGEDPLGKQIMGGRAATWKTVVGVMADTKNGGLNQNAIPEVLFDGSAPGTRREMLFLVRTPASEGAVARGVREQLRASRPNLFLRTQTLDAAISQKTASPRFNSVLISAFALVALVMAVVGVYGVLAFSVAQRRQEIGVRMALGATPATVLGLVMKEGVALIAVGALAGLGGALMLTRYLTTLLYGVKANDPFTYVVVVAGLSLAALSASLLPARRASAVDPMVALRHE